MSTRHWAAAIVAASCLATAGGAAAQSSSADQMTGRHSMEGQVTSIDGKKGWVHVKTSDGTMVLHFPPSALEGVKKGDTITVALALRDNGPSKK